MEIRAAAAGLVLTLGALHRAAAQDAPPAYVEYRADAIINRGVAAQGGLGIVLPLGMYVRLGIDGAAGVTHIDGAMRGSGRVDAIGRFLLDPFREVPVAVSVGGGVSVPYVNDGTRTRPYATVVVDVEGRRKRGMTPAVQVGLGGGARIGVVIRASPLRWR
jgi:hypothetical protein